MESYDDDSLSDYACRFLIDEEPPREAESAGVHIYKYDKNHISMNDYNNVFTPNIVNTGVGGENQIRVIDSHDLPRLTSKRDDCCVLIDEYNTSTDVRIDK